MKIEYNEKGIPGGEIDKQNTEDILLQKAQEAFALAIEIYNKPTIKYRLEGFSFFICNAWELMLKAYLIVKEGEDSIYFPDNQKRTISLVNWETPQLCWGTNRV